MQPAPPSTDINKVGKPCRLAIFENTCEEWLIAALGAFSQSITVVTVYATLGMEAVDDAINDNVIPVIVCNKSNVGNLVDNIKKISSLKTIVYTNDLVGPNDDIVLPKAPRGVKIISFQDFIDGGDVKAYPPTPPSADTCAVVMYTSGSTGKPKGVIITHGQ